MEYLQQVIIEDSLGIAAELEAEMAHQVATYACEWDVTLKDPVKLQRFQHFVNSDAPDPNLIQVEERGQKRPVFEHERQLLSIDS
jgi:nitrite reductase (NADH) large subunit